MMLPHPVVSEIPDIPILRALRNTDRPVASYVWRAWLISFIPSLVIALIVTSVLGSHTVKTPAPKQSPISEVFGVVVLSPWVETFLMWPILAMLKRFSQSILWLALGSALIWGGLHSLFIPTLGVPASWGFFVFSVCFLEWEKKSKTGAIVVTALVHMCQNGLPDVIGSLLTGLDALVEALTSTYWRKITMNDQVRLK
jgi:hypothetical protein